ncbi:unnamed protein product [Medioppia subpectinata]|uniref:Sodefrin-like factor n=1 Tax=Medioppia subpectinata TaxID=1979941 RepID=A0A7R9Q5K4_9ACAR|nr:unnamed protein product [Medioppia subpectinata]CAG2113420.1 unnamed protein product [Medioppia subpectinata]
MNIAIVGLNASLIYCNAVDVNAQANECSCGLVAGNLCGSVANKQTIHGIVLKGNCLKNGFYYITAKAVLYKVCPNCHVSARPGYDWCQSEYIPDPVLCQCGGVAGDHCGVRANVPGANDDLTLKGECRNDGYYHCKADEVGQAQLKFVCPICTVNDDDGLDTCDSTYFAKQSQ